jgi:hypothetical protein
MGDQMRMTPEGPRSLSETDYRADNEPKVIRNPQTHHITASPMRLHPFADTAIGPSAGLTQRSVDVCVRPRLASGNRGKERFDERDSEDRFFGTAENSE